jgi:hypothetical protein
MMAAAALTGCATMESRCVAGQAASTAQLFFGRNVGGEAGVSDGDFRRFVDEELTPRFPDGLTVLDADGQWRGSSGVLVREPSKVVLIVLTAPDALSRLEAVRAVYKARFKQDSVMLLNQRACVSF